MILRTGDRAGGGSRPRPASSRSARRSSPLFVLSTLVTAVVFHLGLHSNISCQATFVFNYTSPSTVEGDVSPGFDLGKPDKWTSTAAAPGTGTSTSLPRQTTDDDDEGNADTTPASVPALPAVPAVPAVPATHQCTVVAIDPYQANELKSHLERAANLIEIRLLFPNSSVNPLTVNLTTVFKVCSHVTAYSLKMYPTPARNYGAE